MGFKEILTKIREKATASPQPEREYADNETRDKYLRSLRRERRVQNEEVEKIKLKKEIEEFNKERTKKYMYGSNPKAEQATVKYAGEDKYADISDLQTRMAEAKVLKKYERRQAKPKPKGRLAVSLSRTLRSRSAVIRVSKKKKLTKKKSSKLQKRVMQARVKQLRHEVVKREVKVLTGGSPFMRHDDVSKQETEKPSFFKKSRML